MRLQKRKLNSLILIVENMSDENTQAPAADAAAPAAEETKQEEAAAPEATEEAAPAADTTADEGADVEVPAKFKDLVEAVENMSVLDLNELVKLLEKKFGVSAAAVAVAGPAAGGDAGAEEKDSFTVELTSDGGAKIPVMKVVKELLGLGLKEAKELVESVPAVIKEGAKKEEAEDIKAKIEEAGGKVELK